VKSPCIGVCKFDPETGLCKACLRTRTEAKSWKKMSETAQLEIVAARPGREAELRLAKAARRAIKKADKLAKPEKPKKLKKLKKSGKAGKDAVSKSARSPKAGKGLKKSARSGEGQAATPPA
jgi:predicted Fe-S protein YdhL (DUF1289 family)